MVEGKWDFALVKFKKKEKSWDERFYQKKYYFQTILASAVSQFREKLSVDQGLKTMKEFDAFFEKLFVIFSTPHQPLTSEHEIHLAENYFKTSFSKPSLLPPTTIIFKAERE